MMSKKDFYFWALERIPKGKEIAAINYLCLENRYVALLSNEGSIYPFTGKFYEPIP